MRELLRRQWRALLLFIHSKDALVYLAFVLMATIIWFSNAFSTRRTVTTTIPVTYTLPDNYIFTVKPAEYIRITMEDEGIDLFRNRKRQYALHFDLSAFAEDEEGTFLIPMDEIRQSIAQQMVGDAGIMAFTPEVLSGSYSRQHEKVVPVVYSGQIKPAAQHQIYGEVELTPDSVRVYGNEQDLAAIQRIVTVETDYEGVQDTFVTRLPLICPEGVRLLPDSIYLRAVGEQFTERAMTLPICAPDLGRTDRKIHLFPSQVTVTFRVGTTWFKSIKEQDIEVFVERPQEGEEKLQVKVTSTNPHITHMRVKPEEVEYLIESYETTTDGRSAESVSED